MKPPKIQAARKRLALGSDPGMATTFIAISMCVLGIATVVILQFTAAIAQHQQLRNTADLAALSGAQAYVAGASETETCAVASEIARESSPEIQVQCQIEEPFVQVELTEPGAISWLSSDLSAEAVAGPEGEEFS